MFRLVCSLRKYRHPFGAAALRTCSWILAGKGGSLRTANVQRASKSAHRPPDAWREVGDVHDARCPSALWMLSVRDEFWARMCRLGESVGPMARRRREFSSVGTITRARFLSSQHTKNQHRTIVSSLVYSLVSHVARRRKCETIFGLISSWPFARPQPSHCQKTTMTSPVRKDALILVGQSSFPRVRSRLSCLTNDWRRLLARS